MQQQIDQLRDELERSKAVNEGLFAQQNDSVTFVLTCLEDVKRQMARGLQDLRVEERKRVLDQLLAKLSPSQAAAAFTGRSISSGT